MLFRSVFSPSRRCLRVWLAGAGWLAFGAPVHGQALDIANSPGVLTLAKGYSRRDSIRFYNADGTQWYVFSFYYDDSDGAWDFPNANFRPLAFHPDYFLLRLAVVRQDSGGYEVVVNHRTGLTKRVRRTRFLQFRTWEEHVLSAFGLDVDSAENPIHTAPSDSAPSMPYPGK